MSRQAGGLRAWVAQRITAVYLGLFLPIAVIALLLAPPTDHQAWRELLAHPWVMALSGLAVLSLLLHAWVGMRDILIDYVKPFGLRFALLVLLFFALAGQGIWALRILGGIA